jgi:ABC-2 type transport system permease protein
MRKVLLIAVRDYLAIVRTKAFVISLVVMPVLMGGGHLAQILLRGQVDPRAKLYAIVDRSPDHKFFELFKEKNKERRARDPSLPVFDLEEVIPSEDKDKDKQRVELSDRVKQKGDGQLHGFLEIGPDVYVAQLPSGGKGKAAAAPVNESASVRYQTSHTLDDAFLHWAMDIINEHVTEKRCKQDAIPVQSVKEATAQVPYVAKGLSRYNPETEQYEDAPDENKMLAFFLPFGLMIFMFMVIMVGASPLMQGVVEEKMQRIAEVLLASVPPFPLMMGKLLGTVGVTLTLVAVYLGGAYWGMHWAARQYGFGLHIPIDVIIWFVVFQVMAVLMYGSLFIAIGAACTDMKETQSLLWPVMLLATFPLFVWFNVIQEPNSTFAIWTSLIPTATPMLMIARLAVPPQSLPWWQPALGVVLTLATTLFCIYAAGRIFRVGILMQGKGARFGEMIKWVFRG